MKLETEAEIHPLLVQDYALYTKPIDEMYQQIEQWIDSRVTGAYVYGLSRTGKTKAVTEWFPNLLRENYRDRIAIFRCIYQRQDKPSQRKFAQSLAQSLDHNFPTSMSSNDLEWRVGSYLTVRGLQTKLRQVVLFVDEAQYLREAEFHSLCNIQNIAAAGSVRLSVISIGTQQLQQQSQVFILGNNTHLSTRFFGYQARFRGIRSATELAHVLDGFDTQTDWPADSGISYTHYFFPGAFQGGFRFANHAETLWSTYLELAPLSIREKLEVPMEYVVAPIESVCRSLATERPDFTLGLSDVQKAVKQTSYFTVMRGFMRAGVGGR